MLKQKKPKPSPDEVVFELATRLQNAAIHLFDSEFENSVMKRLARSAEPAVNIWTCLIPFYRPFLATGLMIMLITLAIHLLAGSASVFDINEINGLDFDVLLADALR